LVDLGAGCGRLCMQVFLQFPNIQRVLGVELASTRSRVGFTAMRRLNQHPQQGWSSRLSIIEQPTLGTTYTIHWTPQNECKEQDAEDELEALPPPPSIPIPRELRSHGVTEEEMMMNVSIPPHHPNSRMLELRHGDMFQCQDCFDADILICETNITPSMQYEFFHFLSRFKPGCRLLTYNNLDVIYEDICNRIRCGNGSLNTAIATPLEAEHKGNARTNTLIQPPFPWRRMAINTPDDKFSASWGQIRFHLYTHCGASTKHEEGWTSRQQLQHHDVRSSSLPAPSLSSLLSASNTGMSGRSGNRSRVATSVPPRHATASAPSSSSSASTVDAASSVDLPFHHDPSICAVCMAAAAPTPTSTSSINQH